MADEKTCAYCGTALGPGDEICPSCGAPNPHHVPGGEGGTGTRKPRTIEELRAFCESKGMPLEKMRFFIGINEPSPRAFGIYREGDRFVVYKNKSDGSRAVRYDGPDEAYAVNELYLKLLEEHRLRQNGGSGGTRSSGASRRPKSRSTFIIIAVVVLYLLLQFAVKRIGHRKDGYYSTGDNLYYRYGSSWYMDSGYDDWVETDSFPADDYGSYYVGNSYNDSWDGSDFMESDTWDSLQDSGSDSDSDWDYDYDDWDSGDTDWDSDW